MSLNLLYANDAPGADAPSYYAATALDRHPSAPLAGDVRADICVVGGGYTGLSAALHLARRGFDVALVEAHRVGWGASGRNGGQVGWGQRLETSELDEMVGPDAADRLWRIAEEAVATVKDLVSSEGIACDLKPGVMHTAHRARYAPEMREEADALKARYDYDVAFLDREETRAIVGTDAYHAALLDPNAAHLHPLNYAIGLAKAAKAAGARIYEMSEVVGIERGAEPVVRTGKGSIRAGHVVLAANGYLGDLAPEVASRVMPINNFILATEPLGEALAQRLISNDVAVADSKFVVNYYRLSADRRLLFGGRESYGYRFPRDLKGFVRKAMLEIYPQLSETRIDYGWGGTLAITMSRMPYFARLAPTILSCSGYSGHGVAMATMAGKIAAEAVAGQAERFDVMASVPTPRFPGGPAMRSPLLAAAMLWYSLRDRL